MIVQIIDYFRDRLKSVIKVCYAVLAALVVLDAMPTVVDKHHAHTWVEHLPGFWSVFGYIACVLPRRWDWNVSWL